MELGRISLNTIKQAEGFKQMENGAHSLTVEAVPSVEAVVLKALDPPSQVIDGPKQADTISPPQTLGDLNLVLRTETSSSDSSDSDDDDDDEITPVVTNTKDSKSLPEKRRRSQPVKFEPSPIGSRKHITKPHTPRSVPSKVFTAGKLRGTRCGRCSGCLKEDCGKCIFCKDKPKFGGPGKKKQRCKHRVCTNFQRRTGSSNESGPTRPYPSINGDASVDEPSTSAAAGRKVESDRPLTAGQISYNKLAKQMASTKPTQGGSTKPTQGASSKPTQGASTKPTQGASSKPTQGASTKPTQGASTKPTQGASTKPTQGASTKPTQGAKIELEKEPVTPLSSVTTPTHQTIPAVVMPPTTLGASEVLSSPKVNPTKTLTVDITPSTSNGTSIVDKKLTSLLNPGKVVPKSALVSTAKLDIKKPSDRMTCIQCGRERALSMARTDQFCTQRCITNWEESNSSKQQPAVREVKKVTVAEVLSAKTESPPPKSIPRALKNLQIDMAKPGTKLMATEGEDAAKSTASANVATRSSLINSLASMISQSQKQMDSPKLGTGNEAPSLLAASAAAKIQEPSKSSSQPAKVAAKRSSNIQLAPMAKKAKLSTKTTPQSATKSVSFNLKTDENGNGKASSPSPSNVIPLIASMLQPKKSHDLPKIKLPSGLPSDIRQWTVGHVIHYFKSTTDCQDYIDLFEAQEVDGIALLLLTHETLVKCLGIKLGRALKIMNRVQELKRYHDHKSSK